ncbi:PAS domain S-box protein [Candidatus Chloroploca sp. Khr17]|uniref:PAS domain S-box protein n=1 Tax=Candidatus Chloroploca sp. Khr17 TaxID=2496869 RepID=UPI00101D2B89|nr:PAS domain S-box protein [Candidatus Chloroploca sp. Khr17]
MQNPTSLISPSRRLRLIGSILLLALLYGAVFRTTLFFLDPLDPIVAVWPAAGVALAGVVVGGYWLSLGVLVGGLLASLSLLGGPVTPILALVFALGSTMQALLGAFLLRRFASPLPPRMVKLVVRGLLLNGVTAVVAPAVSIVALAVAGALPWAQVPILFGRWWISAYVGILILTPAIIVATRIRHNRVSLEVMVGPLASLMVGLAFFAFTLALNYEERQLRARLEADSAEMVQAVEATMLDHGSSLLAVRSFYEASDQVTRAEFLRFVTPLRERSPSIQTIAWAPVVAQEQRAAFEQALREEGFPSFTIFERDAAGQPVPAAERMFYVPATFFEPFELNRAALGFDMGSEQIRAATIMRARDRGEPALSPQLKLISTDNDDLHVLLVSPLYNPDLPLNAVAERQVAFEGVAFLILPMERVFEQALVATTRHDLEFYLFDVSEREPDLLAWQPSRSGSQDRSETNTFTQAELYASQYVTTRTLELYGRTWEFVARPGPAYVAAIRGWMAWPTLVIGLFTATLFLLYIRSRQRTDLLLAQSQASLEMAQEVAHLGSWELDLATGKGLWSQEMFRLFGRDPAAGAPQFEEFMAWVHPDDQAALLAAQVEVLATHERVTIEYRLNPSLGRAQWFEATISWIQPEGKPQRVIGTVLDITERKLALETLRVREEIFSSIVSQAMDAIALIDAETRRFVEFNEVAHRDLGYTREEFARMGITDIQAEHTLDEIRHNIEAIFTHGQAAFETEHRHRNGAIRIVSVRASRLILRGHPYIAGVWTDITERKQAEVRLHKLNRAYMVLSEVNETIVRVRDAQILFTTACQIAVAQGGFRMAWIGLLDPGTSEVQPVAWAGEVGDYLGKVRIALDESPRGRGPTAMALRQGEHIVVNDLANDPRMAPWREDALRLGYHALAVFPLIVAGKVEGSLNLYAPETDFFDQAELKLFDEMAIDIAFALEFMAQEQQRREAEAQIRTSERRSRALLAAIPDIMFRVNYEGVILDYSAMMSDLLYVSPDVFLGKSFRDVLPLEVGEQWQIAIDAAFTTDALQTFEYQLMLGDKPHFFEARLSVNQSEREAVAIVRNVTEARRSAAEIVRLSRVVEQMDDIVLIADINGIIQYVNPAFERQFGFTCAEVIGQTPRILKSGLENRALYTNLWATILSGESFHAEFRNRRKDGQIIYEAKTITPVRDEHGVITNFVATGKDITMRKQMEHDLQERLKELTCLRQVQRLLDQNPSLDALGRQVIGYLVAAMQYPELALATIELDGCSYRSTEDDEPLDQLPYIRAEILAGGVLIGCLKIFYLEDAQLIPEEQNMLDSIAHALGLWLERRRAEEALINERNLLARRVDARTADLSRTNLELARAVRAKDDFLANMSHELRTPLNAILALSEGLLEQLRGPLNERQQASLRNIEVSGRHLLALINDILDLSKVEAGRMDLQPETLLVSDICEASMVFVKELANKKQIQLHMQINEPQARVEADPKRLKQILVNLLSNAVKFTLSGGRVSLCVEAQAGEGAIRFAVEDTGIGMEPEGIAQLFKPFMQLDSSLSRQHEGTGLGLALVRRLVELHGGSVTVTSEPGKGSCFTVALPYPPLPTVPARLPTKSADAPASDELRSALVIEDSETAGEQIARYLEELNIHAVIYGRGVGAVEQVARLHPDVIFLDLQMPEQSGWEILAQLKADPVLHVIPVIIISVVDDRVSGLAAGAAEYLVKPISRETLRRALGVAVHKPQAPREAVVIASAPARRPSATHILMAEDNEVNIVALGDYLQDKGYRLSVARNGREALDLAAETPPDLVLMDIQMPELDGLEAIRQLRADPTFTLTPIIALTALAMPGDRERCMEAGASEYLTKPVSLRGLVETIERLLDHPQGGYDDRTEHCPHC